MDLLYTILLLIVAFCLYVWFIKPELLVKAYARIGVFMSGCTVKRKTDNDGFTWEYMERGQPSKVNPSMLFIHGFSSTKESWNTVIMKLRGDQHIIALDLPGHGHTDRVQVEDDVCSLFVQNLLQFVGLVGLDSQPFHMIGMSMGGAITLCYSATYPQHVAGASILSPAIGTPEISVMSQEIKQGRTSPFLDSQSVEGMKRKMKMIANREMRLPEQILKGFIAKNRNYQDFFTALYKRLADPENRQKGITAAGRVTCPSQVIWGADDKIIHVSGAEVLQGKLPNMKSLHILPRCGHSIVVDKPGELANILTEFHNKLR